MQGWVPSFSQIAGWWTSQDCLPSFQIHSKYHISNMGYQTRQRYECKFPVDSTERLARKHGIVGFFSWISSFPWCAMGYHWRIIELLWLGRDVSMEWDGAIRNIWHRNATGLRHRRTDLIDFDWMPGFQRGETSPYGKSVGIHSTTLW